MDGFTISDGTMAQGDRRRFAPQGKRRIASASVLAHYEAQFYAPIVIEMIGQTIVLYRDLCTSQVARGLIF